MSNSQNQITNIAHTRNEHGIEQSMREHTQNVAELARNSAPDFLKEVAYLVGIYHDLGKYNPDFQAYLQSQQDSSLPPRGSVNHKAFGAIWLMTKYANEKFGGLSEEELSSWRYMLGRCIAGHHGGLTSDVAFHAQCEEHYAIYESMTKGQVATIQQEMGDLIAGDFYNPKWSAVWKNPQHRDMMYRMLFSSLVDADGTDTQQHFEPARKKLLLPSLQDIYPVFVEHHDEFSIDADDSPINKARARYVEQSIESASLEPGWFQMDMPTGSGKTLASMRFAFEHAKVHGQKRIITVVPFLTITEQNASVYRKAFGEHGHALLEHHSGKDSFEKPGKMTYEQQRQYREVVPRWDSSVILTTLVQLVDTLSHYKVSHLRKMHRLANSVIVIDEAQTIPSDILSAVLNMLNFFVEHCNTTVVLTTATHAAYDQIEESPLTKTTCRQVVEKDESGVFDRVKWEYLIDKKYTHDEIAQRIAQREDSSLTIVNSKDDARKILESVRNLSSLPVMHLSTNMCKAHRQDALADIKQSLANKQPLHVISTQLIEAGVDLDFPQVFRVMAPLESLIQASGRCNREGTLKFGTTTVFLLDDSKIPPGAYKTATGHTHGNHITTKLKNGEDPFSAEAIYEYFASLYPFVPQDKAEKNKKPLSCLRKELDFPAIQETMRVIDQTMVPIVVPYNSFVPDIDALKNSKSPIRKKERVRIADYIVQIPRYKKDHYYSDGLLTSISDIEELYVWSGQYDAQTGIVIDASPEFVY